MSGRINLWSNAEHAEIYLSRAHQIPHRAEGEAALLEFLPAGIERFLDLGCGNGRLLSVVRQHAPAAEAVGLDFSATMLQSARERFPGLVFHDHNMERPLPRELGSFDAVVSSFAIHHLPHERKRALYGEIFACLRPGGMFLNLEHVDSPTPELHADFLRAAGRTPEEDDPSNQLLDVETQLCWLREIGYEQVDCHWKWRELALLAGRRPA